jgi:hypothetical protein
MDGNHDDDFYDEELINVEIEILNMVSLFLKFESHSSLC